MARMINGISQDLIRAAFCDYFGIRDKHADILVILYERGGDEILTKELARTLDSHRPPSFGAIHERVRFLREILEAESLDTVIGDRGNGYQLTEIGISECARALRVMAEALTKCGPAAIIDGVSPETIRRISEAKSAPLRDASEAA